MFSITFTLSTPLCVVFSLKDYYYTLHQQGLTWTNTSIYYAKQKILSKYFSSILIQKLKLLKLRSIAYRHKYYISREAVLGNLCRGIPWESLLGAKFKLLYDGFDRQSIAMSECLSNLLSIKHKVTINRINITTYTVFQ